MLNRFITHFRQYRIREKKTLYLLGLVILFWALFDGVFSYLIPIAITDNGVSKTLMGIILGTSSIAGALFDFIACRLFRTTYYKRLFLIMFAICLIFPFILLQAHSFMMFIIAMALWGIYYDLRMIGTFNYIGRFTKREEHSENFGVLQVFPAVGYLIAPLMVGFLIADTFDWKPFILAWIFLAISILFFLILIKETRKEEGLKLASEIEDEIAYRRSIWSEAMLWGRVARILFPVLFLTFFLNVADAFFWTLGPLVAQNLPALKEFSGVFMTVYTLPPLLVGWFVGTFTRTYGKKRTSFYALFCGSMFLILFSFIVNPFALILDVFMISVCLSMAYPAINGAYADYIAATTEYEKEIEGLEDFYTNGGYVIGPMLAGFLADQVGSASTFTILGALGALTALTLLFITPRKIDIRTALDQPVTS